MQVEARLFTPGPLCLSSYVKTGMLFDIGSRDVEFKIITREIRERILTLADAESSHSVIPIQGSGTFAMEAALTTFIGPHEKTLVCINGAYGERIAKILKTHGRAFLAYRTSSTQVPDVSEVEKLLADNPDVSNLCFVHCECPASALLRQTG